MEQQTRRNLEKQAYLMRRRTLEMIRTANSGHIGGSFSIADMLSVLYFLRMRVDPGNPRMPGRDRLILSKGHCAPVLYAALSMRGYFPDKELDSFRRIDGHLSGHVEMLHVPGVDMSSGSLGQGLSIGVGMALSAKTYHGDYKTFVIMGDGEIQEGQVWEAVMSAAKYKLDNLVAVVDLNGLQLDGTTEEIMPMEPLAQKFEAFGWRAIQTDGNNVSQFCAALEKADATKGMPTVIIAKTIKGKGVSVFEDQVRFHGGRPTAEEYTVAFQELNAKIAELEE